MSVNAPTALVTGANGYLSCHVINELLRKGYHVRGTVRSKAAECVVRDTFPEAFGSKLKVIYVRDLTNPKEFKDSLTEDIIGVVHAASPAPSQVEDNVRDMLDPAVKGATSILEACKLYAGPSLKRVIHISSFAACLDISKGFRPGYNYSESDWNPTTFEQATTIEDPVALYIASKALSERAVWSWMEEQRPPFDLASLAPVTVFGPHLEQVSSMDAIKSTARLLWHLMDAEKIPEPDFPGCVDVRDTAAMVVAALETPEAGGNRFVLSQQFDWQTAADYARNGLGDARDRIPEGKPGTGKDEGLLTMYQINGSKAVDVLKVDYRPLSVTITDTLSQFLAIEKTFTE